MTGGSDMEWMSLNTDEPVRMGETYYHYDTANQLVREDNMWLGKTFLWTYDDAGNITSCKEYAYINNWEDVTGTPTKTNTYTYGDSAWGDLLTAYNGVQWSYDQIGNLPNDGTWTYTWQNGRELASMSDGETTWTYTYDANGMRTSRTDGTTTYSYIYNGGKLIQMTRGTDTLEFYYDAVGAPVIVKYNGEVYNYVTTLQGDVMLILDTDGEIVVEYAYDAWGGHMTVSGSMASTLGAVNPLTYRGYVYDTETGLYYLLSRYYNPEIGRFLNADDIDYLGAGVSLTSYNLFAYCGNNPVMGYDPAGHWNWGWKEQATLGAAVLLVGIAILLAVPTGGSSLTVGALALSSTTVTAVGGTLAVAGTVMVGEATGQATIHCAKQSRKSDKERSTDKPSWVSQSDVDPNKSAQQNAKELMDDKYGSTWPKGTREYSQIVKWINRCVRDLVIGVVVYLCEE